MTFTPRIRGTRRRTQRTESDITLEDLIRARRIAARVVREDPVYLPIFERLEDEIEKRQSSASALHRALRIAEDNHV